MMWMLRISRGGDQACEHGSRLANDLSKETKLQRSEGEKFSPTAQRAKHSEISTSEKNELD
jgi:hypothetical protein